MYSDKVKSWAKIFVHKVDDDWQTDLLNAYADALFFQLLKSKLSNIFNFNETDDLVTNEDIDKAIAAHACFLLELCS